MPRVTKEQAVMLKEVGYDRIHNWVYTQRDRLIVLNHEESNVDGTNNITAPTLHEASDWLRETHGIHCYVEIDFSTTGWTYCIQDLHEEQITLSEFEHETYDSALSAALTHALTILKERIKQKI